MLSAGQKSWEISSAFGVISGGVVGLLARGCGPSRALSSTTPGPLLWGLEKHSFGPLKSPCFPPDSLSDMSTNR